MRFKTSFDSNSEDGSSEKRRRYRDAKGRRQQQQRQEKEGFRHFHVKAGPNNISREPDPTVYADGPLRQTHRRHRGRLFDLRHRISDRRNIGTGRERGPRPRQSADHSQAHFAGGRQRRRAGANHVERHHTRGRRYTEYVAPEEGQRGQKTPVSSEIIVRIGLLVRNGLLYY